MVPAICVLLKKGSNAHSLFADGNGTSHAGMQFSCLSAHSNVCISNNAEEQSV